MEASKAIKKVQNSRDSGPKESFDIQFKRYHKARIGMQAADDVSMASDAVTEEADSAAVAEPEGTFIDEGPFTDAEMAAIMVKLSGMTIHPAPAIATYGNVETHRPRFVRQTIMYFEYSIIFQPANPAPEKRTILVQDLPSGTDHHSYFPDFVQAEIRFRIIPVTMPKFNFKGSDGSRQLHEYNCALVIFNNAEQAMHFYEGYKMLGYGTGTTVLLETPTNPNLGK